MDIQPYLWLLRPLLSFAIAYFLVRRVRNFLHKVVVRLMPVNQRFAPGSFEVSTRWVNISGIVLVVLFSAILFKTIGRVMDTVRGGPEANNMPIQQPNYAIVSNPKMVPVQPLSYEAAPSVTERFSQNYPTPSSHERPPTPYETPSVAAPYQPLTAPASSVPVPFTDPHYIQLGAFALLENAQRHQARQAQQPTRIGFVVGDLYPYKVLLGPFPNRPATAETIRSRRLKGFPRPASDLQYLLE